MSSAMKVWQQPLPKIYTQLSDAELRLRIESAKETLGDKLAILGHHYQQDAVIDFADFTGDSFELSQKAAEQKGIEYVVFCGVHFMAESADILTDENVRVVLPDLGAGCSMADMANLAQTLVAWAQFGAAGEWPLRRAASRARSPVGSASADVSRSGPQKVKVLFSPDQPLGRNTAY